MRLRLISDKFRSVDARPKIKISLDDADVAGTACEIAAYVDGVQEQSLKVEAVEATSGETDGRRSFLQQNNILAGLCCRKASGE